METFEQSVDAADAEVALITVGTMRPAARDPIAIATAAKGENFEVIYYFLGESHCVSRSMIALAPSYDQE
jgi:hypothetical protein